MVEKSLKDNERGIFVAYHNEATGIEFVLIQSSFTQNIWNNFFSDIYTHVAQKSDPWQKGKKIKFYIHLIQNLGTFQTTELEG